MDANVISASIAAGTSAVGVFTSMLPHVTDVRDNTDTQTIKHVRVGELSASTIVLGIGLLVSILHKDPAPFFIALLACVFLCGMYESLLHMN